MVATSSTIRLELSIGLMRLYRRVCLIMCVCSWSLRTVQWVVTVCDTPSSWWRFSSTLRLELSIFSVRSHQPPRLGGPTQLQEFTDAVRMAQGNWSTVNGMLTYARGSLQHATLVAGAMHDPSVLSDELVQLAYTLPTVATQP
jgi:hypothetical protein